MTFVNSEDNSTEVKDPKQKKSRFNRYKIHIVVFCAILITFIVYSNSVNNDFVNFDDNIYLTENPDVKNLSYESVRKFFTNQYYGHFQPLTMLAYSLEYTLFGMEAPSFHRTNLMLHILNVLLVFALIFLLTGRVDVSSLVTFFFAVHPMNVESVSWIAGRSSLMFSLFFLASLIIYLLYLKNEMNIRYLILSLLFFIFSLLSKSSAITLPVVLLLMDFFLKRRLTGRMILEKVPFFALSIYIGIIAVRSAGMYGSIDAEGEMYSFFERIFLVCYELLFYLVKCVVPVNLSVLHPTPGKVENFLPVIYYIAPLFLCMIIFGIYRLIKALPAHDMIRRSIVFGILFFLVTIVVGLQIVPVGKIIAAERYVYLPYIGLLLIIGFLFARLTDKEFIYSGRIRPVIYSIFAGVFVFFVVTTWHRNKVWANDYNLFNDLTAKKPEYPAGYWLRGNAKLNMDSLTGAISDYNRVIEMDPDFAKAYYKRGMAEIKMENYEEALTDLNKFMEYIDNYPDAYINRGNIYMVLNREEEALCDFEKAVELEPEDDEIYFIYGRALYHLDYTEKAKAIFEKAGELGNRNAELMLERMGKDTVAAVNEASEYMEIMEIKEKLEKKEISVKVEEKVDRKGNKIKVLKNYNDQGILTEEVEVKNGIIYGSVKEYYENGKLKISGFKRDTIPYGEWKEYYHNGRIKAEYAYETGLMNGSYKYYHTNGKLWTERIYDNGKLWNVKSNYDISGNLKDVGTLKNGSGILKVYNEKGVLIGEYVYKDGERIR